MEIRRFEASVRRGDAAAVIALSGEIDALAEEALNGAYAEAEEADPRTIVLDFDDVEYINSTGIALIVGVLARARRDRRRIAAAALSDHYREIFEITRLADFMDIYPDARSAVDDVSAPAP